jgi:hypothetical protein
VLALGVTSCSGDDVDPLSTLTDPPTTTTTPPPATSTTTTAVTTTQPPTTTSPPDTTTTPPATTSVDDLKAQIAADYVRAYEGISALLAAPSTEGLDQRLATLAAPGSPYFEAVRSRVIELERLGDVVVPADPPHDEVTVETVELVGAEPYTAAALTVCQVDNLKQVTPASNSPVGEEIITSGGELIANRFTSHVVLTPEGWLRDELTTQIDETYPGATECGVRQ